MACRVREAGFVTEKRIVRAVGVVATCYVAEEGVGGAGVVFVAGPVAQEGIEVTGVVVVARFPSDERGVTISTHIRSCPEAVKRVAVSLTTC